MKLSSFSLFRKIGLDLGTNRTRIWDEKLGLLVDEASCIAIDQRVNKVVAVGNDALMMTGRVSDHIVVYFPIRDGLVENIEMAKSFLQVIFQKILPHTYFLRPIVMASIPAFASQIDRQVLTKLLYQLGSREVYLVSQPLASAIGSDVPIADASGSFILNLGAGVVEGGIISFGNLVSFESNHHAGNYLDLLVQQAVKEKHKLNISSQAAEKLKNNIGSLEESQAEALVTGQDLVTSAPKEVKVKSADILSVYQEVASSYVILMRKLLEKVPPELTSDVIDKGILLTGGMASMQGLDFYLVQKMGVPVSVVDSCDQVVIKGLAVILENLDLFKESLGYQTI